MTQYLSHYTAKVKDIFFRSIAFFFALSRAKQCGVLLLCAVVLFAFFRSFRDAPASITPALKPRGVELVNVGDLSSASVPLSLVGLVTSVQEATIRAEGGGRVVSVSRKLGDKVGVGQVIATFENASERAALQQAEGAYEQAKIARDISKINNTTTDSGLNNAKQNAINALASAYITMDDAIRGKTDTIISNPRTSRPTINFLFTDQSLKFKLESKRVELEEMLVAREMRNKTISTASDLEGELTSVLSELAAVTAYLDDFSIALSGAISNPVTTQALIDAQKTILSSVRAAVVANVSSITATKQTLVSTSAGNTIANAGGAASLSSQTNDATVKIALGSYNAALARYEKTIVRSPIFGTINSLSIERGDYATPGQQLAVVSNNGALEVVTAISDSDARRIVVGNSVTLGGSIAGKVTRVAPAIDPLTKKIEVKIGILDPKAGLVNGQSVSIQIGNEKKPVKKQVGVLKIPISSVKITPQGSYVFTVNNSNVLVAQKITTGQIVGEDIQVVAGLTATDVIVRDARGLKEGTEVHVNSL